MRLLLIAMLFTTGAFTQNNPTATLSPAHLEAYWATVIPLWRELAGNHVRGVELYDLINKAELALQLICAEKGEQLGEDATAGRWACYKPSSTLSSATGGTSGTGKLVAMPPPPRFLHGRMLPVFESIPPVGSAPLPPPVISPVVLGHPSANSAILPPDGPNPNIRHMTPARTSPEVVKPRPDSEPAANQINDRLKQERSANPTSR